MRLIRLSMVFCRKVNDDGGRDGCGTLRLQALMVHKKGVY